MEEWGKHSGWERKDSLLYVLVYWIRPV